MSASTRSWLRSIAPHALTLGIIEWSVALALGVHLTRALAEPLASHPDGADALVSEDGRIAIELYFARLAQLESSGASTALALALWALSSVPLHGALAALARPSDENPWIRSIAKTPSLVALFVAQCATLLCLALFARSSLTACVDRALSQRFDPWIALALGIVALVVAALLSQRALFALARAALMHGAALRLCLAHGFNALRARPLRLLGGRAAVDLASLALALLATIAPPSIALVASLAAHLARIALELFWLRRALLTAPLFLSTH
jgi:hypothetical protein